MLRVIIRQAQRYAFCRMHIICCIYDCLYGDADQRERLQNGGAVPRTSFIPFWWRYLQGHQMQGQERGSGGLFLATQTLIFAI